MGQPTVTNILKSNATAWYAPLGEALPSINLVAGTAWGGNWQRIGFTKEPLVVTYEAEEVQIEVQEFLAPVDRMKISHAAMFKTTLAEIDAEYLNLGMDGQISSTVPGSGQVGYDQIDIVDDFHKVKRAWGFEGVLYDESDNALPVRVFLTRATSKISGEMEFSKRTDDYTGFELEINALADPNDEGRLMRWQRVTALALP